MILEMPHAAASSLSPPISRSLCSLHHFIASPAVCSMSPAFCAMRPKAESKRALRAEKSSPSTHAPKASAFVCTQSSADPARTEPSSAAPASTHS